MRVVASKARDKGYCRPTPGRRERTVVGLGAVACVDRNSELKPL